MEKNQDNVRAGVISVIIPVFNIPNRYLQKCINSVLTQSYRHIEVVIVNDCSPNPENDTLLKKHAKTDFRIDYLKLENNGGVSNARNIGLQRATGEWITFVDADDVIPKGTFQKWIDTVLNTDVDIVISRIRFEQNEEGTLFSEPTKKYGIYPSSNSEDALVNAIEKFEMSAWGKIYRRNLFENLQFPTGITNYEDYNVLWQIALKYPSFAIIDHIGYVARWRPESASRSRNGLTTYRKRVHSLMYAINKQASLFKDYQIVRKYLLKFFLIEGLANKTIYGDFDKTDTAEVVLLSQELRNAMREKCILPLFVDLLLKIRIEMLKYDINKFPLWQYAPIRLALRLI